MITPTIHLNGTSGSDLLEQVCDAASALRMALDAMANAGPNARDYYPQGDHAFTQARAEHVARQDQIRRVIAEYDALAGAIDDAMTARKR